MPHAASQSSSALWWSRDVGPAHVVSLCSYADTSEGSLQRRWLEKDLKRVDRNATPWVIVMIHVPWCVTNSTSTSYNTYSSIIDNGIAATPLARERLEARGPDYNAVGHCDDSRAVVRY